MAVTLSIGIGMNGDTYIQNYEYARTAIDMALGRGGDQAVVKCGQKIQYYGGKAQQLERRPVSRRASKPMRSGNFLNEGLPADHGT